MSHYIEFIAAAQLADLIVAISATAILIAGAITVARLCRAAARRLPAWTRKGRSTVPPVERPDFFPLHPNCRCIVAISADYSTDENWIAADPPRWEWPSRQEHMQLARYRTMAYLIRSAR